MTRPELAVSIVHYNTPELLYRCLEALSGEASSVRMRITVVDNASSERPDGRILARYPNVSYVQNERNVGFGRGNNQTLRGVDADAYLVTNADVIVSPGSLRVLLDRLFADPRLGLLGTRLRYPDGRIQESCRRYPTLRTVLFRGFLPEKRASRLKLMRRYLMADESIDRPTPVDWLLGSCLLLKREAVDDVAGFDEGFFMYYEDVDLCYRIAKAGWGVEYHPDVEWIHDYRRQSARPGQWKLRAVHFASAMRFLLKHAPRRGILSSV